MPGMQMQCGGELNSPLPLGLDAPTFALVLLKAAWLDVGRLALALPSAEVDPSVEGGPPGGAAFVQIFLSRRLLAHAPPVRVA